MASFLQQTVDRLRSKPRKLDGQTRGQHDENAGSPLLQKKLEKSLLATPRAAMPASPGCLRESNTRVVLRVRPLNERERLAGASTCLTVAGAAAVSLAQPSGEPRTYAFDHVVGEDGSQEAVFRAAGREAVANVLEGFNACILAYGQTGAGKTHTMLGAPGASLVSGAEERRGLAPRVLEQMFAGLREQERQLEAQGSSCKHIVRCSVLEIYNDQIRDLQGAEDVCLEIREDIRKGVFVVGLQDKQVHSAAEVMELLQGCLGQRRVAETRANDTSSRSHAVITCTVEQAVSEAGGGAGTATRIRRTRLQLVDLAGRFHGRLGSERQSQTGADGARLQEACHINKSLSALGLVMSSLAELQTSTAPDVRRHVPYRDSKLTRLLQDSLGGNSKTVLVAAVSPATVHMLETLSTLRFADKAKSIRTNAVVNEDIVGQADALELQIKLLGEQLAAAEQEASRAKCLALEKTLLEQQVASLSGQVQQMESVVQSLDHQLSPSQRRASRELSPRPAGGAATPPASHQQSSHSEAAGEAPEVPELLQQLLQLEESCAELLARNQDLLQAKASVERDRDALHSMLASLREQLEEEQREREDALQSLDSVEQHAYALECAAEGLRHKLHEAREALARKCDEVEAVRLAAAEGLAAARGECGRLREELGAAEFGLGRLEGENSRLQAQLFAKSAEVLNLRDQLKQLGADLRAQLKQLGVDMGEAGAGGWGESERAGAQAPARQAPVGPSAVFDADAAAAAVNATTDAAAESSGKDSQLKKLQEQVVALQAQLAAATGAAAANLSVENAELYSELAALRGQFDALVKAESPTATAAQRPVAVAAKAAARDSPAAGLFAGNRALQGKLRAVQQLLAAGPTSPQGVAKQEEGQQSWPVASAGWEQQQCSGAAAEQAGQLGAEKLQARVKLEPLSPSSSPTEGATACVPPCEEPPCSPGALPDLASAQGTPGPCSDAAALEEPPAAQQPAQAEPLQPLGASTDSSNAHEVPAAPASVLGPAVVAPAPASAPQLLAAVFVAIRPPGGARHILKDGMVSYNNRKGKPAPEWARARGLGEAWEAEVTVGETGFSLRDFQARCVLPGLCHLCGRAAPAPGLGHPEGLAQLQLCASCHGGLDPGTWHNEAVWRRGGPEDFFCRVCTNVGPAASIRAEPELELAYCDSACGKGWCKGCIHRFTDDDAEALPAKWLCPKCRPRGPGGQHLLVRYAQPQQAAGAGVSMAAGSARCGSSSSSQASSNRTPVTGSSSSLQQPGPQEEQQEGELTSTGSRAAHGAGPSQERSSGQGAACALPQDDLAAAAGGRERVDGGGAPAVGLAASARRRPPGGPPRARCGLLLGRPLAAAAARGPSKLQRACGRKRRRLQPARKSVDDDGAMTPLGPGRAPSALHIRKDWGACISKETVQAMGHWRRQQQFLPLI